MTKDRTGHLIGFTHPRPCAMAINIAIKEALRAETLRCSFDYSPIKSFWGDGLDITNETTPLLFDFFEASMISVTFSVQALETYCNEIIEMQVKGTIPIKIDKKTKQYNKEQLQNLLSLKRKLGNILPKIFSIDSPESLQDRKVWNQYLKLETVRNKTVHLESIYTEPKVRFDTESLFFEFFGTNIRDYPKYSLDMMDYFKPKLKNYEWLDKAREILIST